MSEGLTDTELGPFTATVAALATGRILPADALREIRAEVAAREARAAEQALRDAATHERIAQALKDADDGWIIRSHGGEITLDEDYYTTQADAVVAALTGDQP